MTSPSTVRSSSLAMLAPAATPAPSHWRRLGQNWLLVLGHLGLLVALYSMLSCFGVLQQVPGEHNLQNWDVGWYASIIRDGYSYRGDGAQSNVAFFPLFPYLWEASGLGAVGISLVNMLAVSVGISLLVTALGCTRRQTLLLASVPPLMFTLVPYTEALFYLFGALLLVGVQRQQAIWLALGMLGCCLTRAAATLLVPALAYAELLAWLGTRATRPALRNLALGGGLAVVGIGGVNWLQHERTGVWLAFYKAQKGWQHEWRWPHLPLETSAGLPMLWLDGLSLGVALACGLLGSYFLVRQVRQRGQGLVVARTTAFALVYCTLAITFTVFQQGGDIANSSRYLLGTPFFAVVLWQAWQRADRRVSWLLLGGLLLLVAKLLGFPNRVDGFLPGQACWYLVLLGGYAALLLLAGSLSSRIVARRELGGVLYCLNLLLLAMLLNWFMQGVWLG